MENPLKKILSMKSTTKDPEKIKYEKYLQKEVMSLGKLAIRGKLSKSKIDSLINDYKKFYAKYPHKKGKAKEQETLAKLEKIKSFASK